MARKLDKFDWNKTKRKGKYPWDSWLDGETYELVRGKDFNIDVEAFRTSVAGAAATRGFVVSTHRPDKKGNSLVIQARPSGEANGKVEAKSKPRRKKVKAKRKRAKSKSA